MHSTDKAICMKRQLLHVMGGGSSMSLFSELECACTYSSRVYVN